MRQLVGGEMQLREEIKRQFEEAMLRYRIKTQKEAAAQIGVTPAAFSLYLRKKATPSAWILVKACKEWDLKIRYDGVEFRANRARDRRLMRPDGPDQLLLFSAIRGLGNDSLDAWIDKKGPDRLHLTLAIKFAS